MNQEPADPDSEFFWMAKLKTQSLFVRVVLLLLLCLLLLLLAVCLLFFTVAQYRQTDRQTNEVSALLKNTE